MIDSILTSAKQLCNGIPAEDTDFDEDVIRAVNSCFFTLHQLTAKAPATFTIRDASSKWADWSGDEMLVAMAIEYVSNKVKLMFDPPQSATAIDLIKEIIAEVEWRISVY